MKISVIVPAYNVSRYINRCIQSIQGQTHKNIEIILVDDGSTDKTPELCDTLARNDSRIIVYHKTNGGVSSARNWGIQHSSGEYIMFVDGDDWIELTCLEKMLQHLLRTGADTCFCRKYFKDDAIKIATSLFSKESLKASSIIKAHLRYGFIASPCLSLSKRNCVSGILFNENIHTLEDWEYNFRCLTKFNKICILDNAYYHYSSIEGSASKSPLNQRKLTCLLIPPAIREHIQKQHLPYEREANYVPVFIVYHLLVCYSSEGASKLSYLIEIRDFARKMLKETLCDSTIDAKHKIYIILAAIHPALFKILYNIKNFKHN